MCPGVSSAHPPDCDGSVAAAVGVVDNGVERLIDPLPQQDSRSGSEGQREANSRRQRRGAPCKTKLGLIRSNDNTRPDFPVWTLDLKGFKDTRSLPVSFGRER